MFAISTRPTLTALLSLVLATASLAPALGQVGAPVRSNPNLRRPVPVAARSARPQGTVAPAARFQEVSPPQTQSGERLPPPSDQMLEVQPRTLRQGVAPEAIQVPSSEVYYDEGMYNANYGDGYYPQDQWCAPMLPMLSCMNFSVRGELLYWWSNPMHTPSLATTSPANTPQAEAGVLGEAGTSSLFGGDLNDDIRFGGRFTGTLWFDACQQNGLELSYTFLSQATDEYSVNSNRLPIIARPFLNAETGLQDSSLVAFPNQLTGALAIDTSTSFHMGDIAYRRNLVCDECRRVDLLIGYRFAYLHDEINIRERETVVGTATPVPVGTTIAIRDQFDSANYFNGLMVGVNVQRQTFLGCTDLWFKSALGTTRMNSTIAGSTVTTANGQTETNNFGFLALPTNIGNRRTDEFSAINELGLRLNRDIGCWRASIGYSVVLWSSVQRAGDLIDTEVNTSQLPPGPLTGSPHPRYRECKGSFWAQGVNFGLERCF
ncbi:BBP7 family outer membrane beta-barrel protein [Anatilimnocola sp. NA78]|uniref:BBP7 family outer membrane beta-barrel protein n=1 Tax=Anatilimnocola sp. NA78 TaxID=3415683 RepID=UPI003CE5B8AF